MSKKPPKDMDSYIAGFPEDVQRILQQLRTLIQGAVPEATEAIKYAMPTFVFHGNLIHFAAFAHHIGVYSVPTDSEVFKEDLHGFKTANGSIQFPLDQPLPIELITKIVEHRVKENLAKIGKQEHS